MFKKRRNWIFCLVTGVLCYALALIPGGGSALNPNAAQRARVRVLSVDNGFLQPLGIVYSGAQECEVELAEGPFKGLRLPAVNHLNSDLEKDKLFEPGDDALAMLTQRDGAPSAATLIDHYRLGREALLFALFAAMMVAFGGVSGCGALVSLALSILVVWKLLVPMVLLGHSAIWCSLWVVLALTVMIDLLVAGPTRTALVAILGSLLGTLITGLLSFLFGNLLKLDGNSLPYVAPIVAQSGLRLNIREIFFSMVFIANSGALMDLSMDIAAACEEVLQHHPRITRFQMLKSGVEVGRKVTGTMTTTLMLAYSGSYLSLLMYFAGQGTPVIDVLNLKYVASEVLITLVGLFGLALVAPFTALVCAWLFPSRAKPGDMAPGKP